MIVYFVSECEKAALPKTRRVLDAFADRIGQRCWQAVMTRAGLETVHQLLRETATKQTAVSCHWVRGRARIQFLWSVGRKDVFTSDGKVSVNFTLNQDVVIEGMSMPLETIYANTKEQHLSDHLFAVGYIARGLVKHFYPERPKTQKAAFWAGVLHDLGKVDVPFQTWLAKELTGSNADLEFLEDGVHMSQTRGAFSWEKYPRHNEISYFLAEALGAADAFPTKKLRSAISHAIYWHHARPLRKEDFLNFGTIHHILKKEHKASGLQELYQNALGVVAGIVPHLETYGLRQEFDGLCHLSVQESDDLEDKKRHPLPDFKSYDVTFDDFGDFQTEIKNNVDATIIRACLVSADRKISGLSGPLLKQMIAEKQLDRLVQECFAIQSDLVPQIHKMTKGFETRFPNSPRNTQQAQAADALADCADVAVLNGPAGCGKTKIALEAAALRGVQQILWICPRVQVCQGLYQELTSAEYLPNVTVEIYTGDFKKHQKQGVETEISDREKFSGDVVVTTIDQVLNSLMTHRDVASLIPYLDAFTVFDEFHEYVNMPGFNLLFAELVKLKQLKEEDAMSTLLVSATPNETFIFDFLEVEAEDMVVVPSFNQSLYQIEFVTYDEEDNTDQNPFFAPQPPHSFVISNTAYLAQQSYLANQSREDALLFHGRFTAEDKADLFDRLYETFGESGTGAKDVLRAGPIVQASLNISCDQMVTDFTTAENWLQRLGRLDRFGRNAEVNLYRTALPKTIETGRSTGKCARFLSQLHTFRSAQAWYEFLLGQDITTPKSLAEIYGLYREFYQQETVQEVVTQDLIASLKKGVEHLRRKIQDPVTLPKKKQKKEKQLKRSSLRSDSRYVQMATCFVGDEGVTFNNDYLSNGLSHLYTLSISEIVSHDENGPKNLLSFMHQKHHKIESAIEKKKVKQAYHSAALKNDAVHPESPIYVSYTPEDLARCHDSPHEYAIYYVQSKQQPVGAMRRDRLPE